MSRTLHARPARTPNHDLMRQPRHVVRTVRRTSTRQAVVAAALAERI